MPGETSSAHSYDVRIRSAFVDDEKLVALLADGRIIATPLAWYPRLLAASLQQRLAFEISADGFGMHWPELDEDLSVQGMLEGVPASASPRPSLRWIAVDEAGLTAARPGLMNVPPSGESNTLARKLGRQWVAERVARGPVSGVTLPKHEFDEFSAEIVASLHAAGLHQPNWNPASVLRSAEESARDEWAKRVGRPNP